MSVRDINKTIIVINALTGEIITEINKDLFTVSTISSILEDLVYDNVLRNENGIIIKNGYKS